MVLARKASGDYGQHNTWAWSSDHLDRPWAYKGELTKEQRKLEDIIKEASEATRNKPGRSRFENKRKRFK